MIKKYRKYYDNVKCKELILRDYLAADRTILACERTLLAYVRTALTALIAGLTVLKFFDGIYYQYLGFAFIMIGIIVTIYGIKNYIAYKTKLEKLIK